MLICFTPKLEGEKLLQQNRKLESFKKILLKSKRLGKDRGKRIKPNNLIKKAAQNMNETISTKYQLAPETIEKRSLNPNDGKYFQEIYDFMRLRKIETNQTRNDQYNEKLDRRKRKLRSPLNLDERVLVLAERLRKKMRLAIFIRLQLIIHPFLIEIGFLLFIKEQS